LVKREYVKEKKYFFKSLKEKTDFEVEKSFDEKLPVQVFCVRLGSLRSKPVFWHRDADALSSSPRFAFGS